MKIFVHALSARRGGSRIFFNNIVSAIAGINKEIYFEVLLPASSTLPESLSSLKNIKTIRLQEKYLLLRLIYENIVLPIRLLLNGFDRYFQIDEAVPLSIFLTRIKSIIVFHASIQFLFPDCLGDHTFKILYWRFLKKIALNFCDIPVTVSYCTKGELSCGKAGIFKKIQVIYHGIDRSIFNSTVTNDDAVLLRANRNKYILSVSTRNPHKNYFRLLQAYLILIKEYDLEEDIILIGDMVWESEENRLKEFAIKNGFEKRLLLLTPKSGSLLAAYYRNASLYVYPSLYDSFGLTPLEAMACGIPCCISRFSAIPEICGDAAEYFDPLDVASMAFSQKKVLSNSDRRKELIDLGIKHSGQFDWKKAAEKYSALLKDEKAPALNV